MNYDVSKLEPLAELIVGEPVRVVRDDELRTTRQAYGLATWNPDLRVKEIRLDGSLFGDKRSILDFVLYHECAHLRLGHVAEGEEWHAITARKAAGHTICTPKQAELKEEQADELAYGLLEDFAHFYIWDFLNGTLEIVDGEPVYAWDTDDVITISE